MSWKRQEELWRCSCGCSRFISVGAWPEPDPDPWLEVVYPPCECWRCRLERAWAALLGRGHADTAVLLTPETARQIITAIRRVAKLDEEAA